MMKWKDILAFLKKHWIEILVCLVMLIAGFFAGRATLKKTQKQKTTIEYVQGTTIHDTTEISKPGYVKTPIDTAKIIAQCVRDGVYTELFPERTKYDTVYMTKSDTTKIMADWASERKYNQKLFAIDTLGTCEVNAIIQYNRLKSMDYTYTPMQKVITNTVYQVKTFSPFIKAGVAFNPWSKQQSDVLGKLGAGLYIKERYGLEFEYQRKLKTKEDYLGTSILFKF